MVINSGVTPTLAPIAIPATDDLARHAAQVLRDLGWQALRRDEMPHPAPVEAGLVLAHPDFGIAMLDIAPARSVDPVARLRRRLAAVGFGSAFRGRLPIIHRCLEAEDLWRLPLVLDHAFAAEPPLGLEGRAWIGMAQQAMLTPPGEAEMVAAERWMSRVPADAGVQAAAQAQDVTVRQADHAAEAAEPALTTAISDARPRRGPPLRALVQFCGVSILVLGAGAGAMQYLAQAGAPHVADPAASAGEEAVSPGGSERVAPHDAPSPPAVTLSAAERQVASPAAGQADMRGTGSPPTSEPDATRSPAAEAMPAAATAEPPIPEPDAPRLAPLAAVPPSPPVAEAQASAEAATAALAAAPAQTPIAEPDAPRLAPLAAAPPSPPAAEAQASAEAATAALAAAPAQTPIPEPDAPRLAPLAATQSDRPVTVSKALPAAAPTAPTAAAAPAEPAIPEADAPRLAPLEQASQRAAGAQASAPAEPLVAEPDAPWLAPLAAEQVGQRAAGTQASAPPEPPIPEPDASSLAPLAARAAPVAAPPTEAATTRLAPATPRQAAGPLPGAATVPPAAATPTAATPGPRPVPTLSPALVAALLARGNQMLEQGDISGARLLFGRAAAAGSAAAAAAMARSFDAAVLTRLGARGIRPDAEQAAAWQRRAAELESAR